VRFGGEIVVDSRHVSMVWEKPQYPVYYFPVGDVRERVLRATGETRHSPSRGEATLYDVVVGEHVAPGAAYRYANSEFAELHDLVAFEWRAMDAWFEEDEEVRVHARSPYTRVDVLPSSRHVRVEVDGVVVAESNHPTLLFETGLPERYYFPKTDVRFDLLERTTLSSQCPYKGTARYWDVVIDGTRHENIVWGYDYPLPESIRVAGLVCFYNERVDIVVDGERVARPQSPFAR
jgi:uncharacterized protein (DUF427 family)